MDLALLICPVVEHKWTEVRNQENVVRKLYRCTDSGVTRLRNVILTGVENTL